jgi:4'-phosphopantetheinyl transferase
MFEPSAFRKIRRQGLAMPCVRVGASNTSLAVWYVDLDASAHDVCGFESRLSVEELRRSKRFRSELHRARYIVGRTALRQVLADYLGCSSTTIRFSYGPCGKPMLEGGQSPIEFNMAHSGGDAVIAVADRAAIGVDIEMLRPIEGVESLARLAFSDVERRELDSARDPVSAFLNGWTRKEAYVKALGLGFTAPMTKITVSLSGRAALFSTGLRDQSVSDWRLLSMPHPRGVVALALGPRRDGTGAM